MNSARDIVFKRCGCTKEKANRQLASRCPHLAESAHGSWYCAVQVTTVGGRKARYRRGGFADGNRRSPPGRSSSTARPTRPRQGHGRRPVAAVPAGAGRAAPAPVDRARLPRPPTLPCPEHRPGSPSPTHRFRVLIKELDWPPIRLHDLRHGAATLALASHTDLKVIQQMLGHSSIITTADT